jgi:hypothetical protein
MVGFVLGLVGGGGSILAVPLLVYVVGVPSPHIAIGTSAIAVALSAATNLAGHARARTVKWPCAITFAIAGMIGAAGGAQLGKMVDGERLLALLAPDDRHWHNDAEAAQDRRQSRCQTHARKRAAIASDADWFWPRDWRDVRAFSALAAAF